MKCPKCGRESKEHTNAEFYACVYQMQESRLERDAALLLNVELTDRIEKRLRDQRPPR